MSSKLTKDIEWSIKNNLEEILTGCMSEKEISHKYLQPNTEIRVRAKDFFLKSHSSVGVGAFGKCLRICHSTYY